MADFSIERTARRGFGGLFSAQGRDDRMQFWIFCALVFGPLIAVQSIAQFVLTFPSFDMIVAAQPDDPAAGRRIFEEQMRGMARAAYTAIGICVLGALLLTAAAARRLHDRCRSGWWALILPPGLFAVALGRARLMSEMTERMPARWEQMEQLPENPETMLAWAVHANVPAHGPDWLAILGGLLLFGLAIELMRAGTDGPNRFGLAPE